MSTTTKTINVNPSATKTVTLPDYNETADITVLTTDLDRIVDGINNLDSGAVHNTGAETVAGVKTFTSPPAFQTSTTSPYVTFKGADLASGSGVIYCSDSEITGNKYGQSYFRFLNYSPAADGASRTSYYERFDLPTVNAGRTANGTYKIITTKNPSDMPGYPFQIILASSDDTWAEIWAKLNVMDTGDSATIYMTGTSAAVLSAGRLSSSYVLIGVVSRTAAGAFQYLLKNSNNNIFAFNMTGASSSSAGTYDGKTYNDDLMLHTSGNESASGTKTWTGYQDYNAACRFYSTAYFQGNAASPDIRFRPTKAASHTAFISANSTGVDSDTAPYAIGGRISLAIYSPKADGTALTGKYERYNLPSVDTGITSGNKVYDILTTKTCPSFQTISITEGSNRFTVANNSRILIDYMTSVAARHGHSSIYVTSSGSVVARHDLGASLSVSVTTNTVTVTSTGGVTTGFCTIFAGSITKNT